MRGHLIPIRCRPSFRIVPLRNAQACRLLQTAVAERKPYSTPTRRLTESKSFTRYTMPQSIRIERAPDMMAASSKPKRTAYVALGSNLGDRIAEIETACKEMDARGIRVKRTSSLWETEPMYFTDQDRFVNGVCEVGEPHLLLALIGWLLRLVVIGRDTSGAPGTAGPTPGY